MCKRVCWRFTHPVNDWKRPRDMPVTVTEDNKIRMTAVLIKLMVCPRLKDDHSGRLAVSQHKLLILSRPKANNGDHGRKPHQMTSPTRQLATQEQKTNCCVETKGTAESHTTGTSTQSHSKEWRLKRDTQDSANKRTGQHDRDGPRPTAE